MVGIQYLKIYYEFEKKLKTISQNIFIGSDGKLILNIFNNEIILLMNSENRFPKYFISVCRRQKTTFFQKKVFGMHSFFLRE